MQQQRERAQQQNQAQQPQQQAQEQVAKSKQQQANSSIRNQVSPPKAEQSRNQQQVNAPQVSSSSAKKEPVLEPILPKETVGNKDNKKIVNSSENLKKGKLESSAKGNYPPQPYHPLKYDIAPVSQPMQQQTSSPLQQRPNIPAQNQQQMREEQVGKSWTSPSNVWQSIKRNPIKSTAIVN